MSAANIWIVDDDRAVRFVLATALSEAGHDVASFDSAESALDALRHRPAPQLLFTDVRMPGDSGLALLARVREHTLAALAHQGVPFEQVVEAVSPVRSLAHSPLFQVMLVLQNTPLTDIRLPELTLSGVALEASSTQFDLSLQLEEAEAGLMGAMSYSTALFEESSMRRWLGHFEQILRQLVTDPVRARRACAGAVHAPHHQ